MTTDPHELSRKFPAVRNYLGHMLLFDRENAPDVASDIACRLSVSPVAVTQSLTRLEGQGLLDRHALRGFSLTADGLAILKRIIARHYLIERLLVDKLGVAWDVADEEADHLQQGLTTGMEEIIERRLRQLSDEPPTDVHKASVLFARLRALLLAAASTQRRCLQVCLCLTGIRSRTGGSSYSFQFKHILLTRGTQRTEVDAT